MTDLRGMLVDGTIIKAKGLGFVGLDGILNVYKEKGYTSHDVVAILRKLLNTKAGHTGTLDPDAEGVLPICLGKATKLSAYIAADVKGYSAQMQLGVITDTQDMSGMVLQKHSFGHLSESEVLTAVLSFQGVYDQTPPMYSAIKINGEKLYNLARKGVAVERKSRRITIYDIQVTGMDLTAGLVDIAVLCSKGTYIRTLCHDIGGKLAVGAAMNTLVRTKSGSFHIDTAKKIDELKAMKQSGVIMDAIAPMDSVLTGYQKAQASRQADKFLYNGNKIGLDMVDAGKALSPGEKVVLYNPDKIIIGIYETVGCEALKPVTILADLQALKNKQCP